jgi:hypothetical protein
MKAILTSALVMICSTIVFSAPTINHNAFSSTQATTKTTSLSLDNGAEENKVVPSEKKSVKPEGTIKESKPADSKETETKNDHSDFKLLQRGKKVLEYKYHLYA